MNAYDIVLDEISQEGLIEKELIVLKQTGALVSTDTIPFRLDRVEIVQNYSPEGRVDTITKNAITIDNAAKKITLAVVLDAGSSGDFVVYELSKFI